MMDLALIRAHLTAVILAAVGDSATIYPAGTTTTVSFPAVIIGMPRWEANTQPCMDTLFWPISAAVARPGSNDPHVISQLDSLWPVVADAVREAASDDQTMAGACKAATVTQADPGYVAIQGQEYPAQTIMLETYG